MDPTKQFIKSDYIILESVLRRDIEGSRDQRFIARQGGGVGERSRGGGGCQIFFKKVYFAKKIKFVRKILRKIRQLALGSGPLCIPSSPFRELHKGVDIFLKIRPLMKIFDQFLCLQSLFFGLRSPHFRCFANPQVGPLAKWVLRINPVCGEVEGGGTMTPFAEVWQRFSRISRILKKNRSRQSSIIFRIF